MKQNRSIKKSKSIESGPVGRSIFFSFLLHKCAVDLEIALEAAVDVDSDPHVAEDEAEDSAIAADSHPWVHPTL